MKKQFILTLIAAMFCCLNMLGADKIQFTTIKKQQKTPACEYELIIAYPLGNSFVENHIKECISEMLGGTYMGDLNNVNALANHYAKERDIVEREGQSDQEIRRTLREWGYGCESMNYVREEISVAYENSKLVNLCHSTEHLMCGQNGSPDYDESYLTVRKSDGRVLGMDMLNEKIHSREFHHLLIEGLKEFVSEDDNTRIIMGDELKNIDLPEGEKMHVTDKYIEFVYRRGEVAIKMVPRVASKIPINKILPYLNAPLRTLLTSSNTNIIENKVDTLAYAYGVSQSKSLKEVMNENGIDTIRHEEFDKGFLKTIYREPEDTLLGNITNLSEEHAFGMRMGMAISSKIIPKIFEETGWLLNPHRFVKGLYDGLNENYPYSIEEATNIFDRILDELKKEKYMDNLLASKKYVDNYSKLSSVKQIPGTSVYYKVLKQGYGAKPTEESTVVVHYEGKNIQDEVFDSSYERNEPATLSFGNLIKGMQEALKSMTVGSIWECVFPYEYAYGSAGAGDEIPPYSALKLKIELLSIDDSESSVKETNEEQYAKDAAEQQTIDRIKSFYDKLCSDETHTLIPLYCTRSFAKQMADEYEYDCDDGQCYAYWEHFPVTCSDVSNWADDDPWCYDGISDIKAIGNGWYQATIKGSGVKTYIVIKYFQMENEGPNAKFNKVTTIRPNVTIVKSESDVNRIHDLVEQQPQFNGNVNSWLAANLKYPPVAAENGIEGRVIVQFVVEEDGSIHDAAVVRGVETGLDREALRVVNSMPNWIPARQNGEVVSCKYTLPIVFRQQ